MRRGDAPTRRETPTPAAPARPRARGWRWLLLLALVAGAGVPLWLAMRGTSAPAPGVAPDATPTATAPALAIAPVDAAPEVAIRDAAAIDLAPERRDSRRPSRREPPGDDAKSPAPETPAGTGHVAIGGAELRLADIIVDGKRIGAAPRMFSLSVGAHQIEVVQPDGRRLGPISVDVTERHTRARPLRPTF